MTRVQTKADLQVHIDRLNKQLEDARGETGRPPTYKQMASRIRMLTDANEYVRQEATRHEEEVARLRYRVEGLKRELDEARTAGCTGELAYVINTGIEPEMLNRLVRLAHPDKHGNSDSANQATAWLLSQRTN